MTEHELYERAKQRVSSHVTLYVGVMLLLAALDGADGGGWWLHWPLLVWGIGVLAHAAAVFGGRLWGGGWRSARSAS